uniref:Glycosyltransferase 2-like domain-containing protein n=1 Tax=Prevotella sp. GTC17262 TaxID=3236797 RepID=A0AB33JHE0_9BACT
MKLSVIIVSYQVKYYLAQCLLALAKALQGIEAEVFVVDNHSTDGTVAFVKRCFPWVKIIQNSENLGFSRANNLAFRQTAGEYVLLLNPDTIVGEEVLCDALKKMDEDTKIGGVGVKMITENGQKAPESRRGVPTPMTAFYKIVGLCKRFPTHRRFGHYYMGYLPWDEVCEIEIISGAFFLIRKSSVKTKELLDEDFFMYGEDIDLSYRLLLDGWKNYYLPLSILHYKGESTSKTSFRYVHVFYKAMLIFFRKHNRNLSFLVFWAIQLAIGLKAGQALIGLLMEQIRMRLGLSPDVSTPVLYCYLGAGEHVLPFEKFANEHGLNYRSTVVTETCCKDIDMLHLDTFDGDVYAVFDTNSFRYKTIIHLLSMNPKKNVHLGLFYPQAHCLITAREVLADE